MLGGELHDVAEAGEPRAGVNDGHEASTDVGGAAVKEVVDGYSPALCAGRKWRASQASRVMSTAAPPIAVVESRASLARGTKRREPRATDDATSTTLRLCPLRSGRAQCSTRGRADQSATSWAGLKPTAKGSVASKRPSPRTRATAS